VESVSLRHSNEEKFANTIIYKYRISTDFHDNHITLSNRYKTTASTVYPHKVQLYRLSVLNIIEETQDVKEEIDEIKVKTDRAHDVLVRRQALVNDIGVVDDVTAKDEATTNCEDKVHGAAKGDEDANEAGHAKGHEAAKQEGAHSFKVILGLEGEQGQSKEDTNCDE